MQIAMSLEYADVTVGYRCSVSCLPPEHTDETAVPSPDMSAAVWNILTGLPPPVGVRAAGLRSTLTRLAYPLQLATWSLNASVVGRERWASNQVHTVQSVEGKRVVIVVTEVGS